MAKDKAVSVTGGCLCGAVRYEAEAFLKSAYICHCTLCQRSTGQPFEIGVPVKARTFRFVKGEPTWFVAQSNGRRAFCGTCGSRLVWQPTDPTLGWQTNVDACCLDNPGAVRPCEHIFTDTSQPWLSTADDLPRYTESQIGPVVERWKTERT